MTPPLQIGEVERGVPIPPKSPAIREKSPERKEIDAALDRLDINESIFIGGVSQGLLAGACSSFAAKRFVTRRVDDGYRVWRVQ